MFKSLKITSIYPKATRVLNSFKNFVIRKARRNLSDSHGSTKLSKSIKGRISKQMNRNKLGRFTGGSSLPSLEFEMNAYGKFVDEGVRGYETPSRAIGSPFRFGRNGNKKYVNIGAIRKFMRRKGITKKGAEFAIARSIYKKGIRRSLFFTRPFEQRYPGTMRAYHKAVADDIAVNVANQLEKLMKSKLNKKK